MTPHIRFGFDLDPPLIPVRTGAVGVRRSYSYTARAAEPWRTALDAALRLAWRELQAARRRERAFSRAAGNSGDMPWWREWAAACIAAVQARGAVVALIAVRRAVRLSRPLTKEGG